MPPDHPSSLPRSLHIVGGVALGGAERFFIRMVNSLHSHGVPVAAVTTAGGKIAAGIDPGVPHYHAPQWSTWDFYSRWKINRAIRDFRPDIVQTYMGRATRIVKLPRGKLPVHVARLGGYYNLKGYRHAHAWVGNTQGILDYLVGRGLPAGRCAHIGNFVDNADRVPAAQLGQIRQSLGIAESQRILLGLGRFHANKGWTDLLDAFALMRDPGLILVMVGGGPLESELKTHAERIGIRERVRWAGWQNDPAPWYQLADVFVCASRHEPLGNVVLEAWANRTLVVSTSSEGPSELMQDGVDGLLTPVGDPAALSQTLQWALALDATSRECMIDAGAIKLNAQFSESAIVQQYLNFYTQLLAEHRHG
jgi:glycosyltransferase involved in cell wall biosynthesis